MIAHTDLSASAHEDLLVHHGFFYSPTRPHTALRENKDTAYLSKTLVTIKTDVPLQIDWDACKAEVDYTRTLALFRELRFESLAKRIPGAELTAKDTKGTKGKKEKDWRF